MLQVYMGHSCAQIEGRPDCIPLAPCHIRKIILVSRLLNHIISFDITLVGGSLLPCSWNLGENLSSLLSTLPCPHLFLLISTDPCNIRWLSPEIWPSCLPLRALISARDFYFYCLSFLLYDVYFVPVFFNSLPLTCLPVCCLVILENRIQALPLRHILWILYIW